MIGMYTLHEEKWIDDQIQQDMDIICAEILKAVKKAGIITQVGYVLRFMDSFRKARKILHEKGGRIGCQSVLPLLSTFFAFSMLPLLVFSTKKAMTPPLLSGITDSIASLTSFSTNGIFSVVYPGHSAKTELKENKLSKSTEKIIERLIIKLLVYLLIKEKFIP